MVSNSKMKEKIVKNGGLIFLMIFCTFLLMFMFWIFPPHKSPSNGYKVELLNPSGQVYNQWKIESYEVPQPIDRWDGKTGLKDIGGDWPWENQIYAPDQWYLRVRPCLMNK